MSGDTSEPTIPRHVLDYLQGQHTLTLATASPTGVPHAATLTYVNEGPAIYVWLRPDATTARHLEQNPAVAFTIDRYSEDWRQTQGVQGSGECQEVLAPAEIKRVVGLFEQKYAGLSGSRPHGIAFYQIMPSALAFIEGTAAGKDGGGQRGAAQALGMSFHKDIVYSVFRDLPAREAATLAGQLGRLQVGPHEVVVRQGAPADKFFIIADGEVEVIREDHGQTRTVATLGPGQFFGELAILRDTPRTATVRTTAPTILLTMERDQFRSLVAQSLATTQNFDQVVQQRLAELGADGA